MLADQHKLGLLQSIRGGKKILVGFKILGGFAPPEQILPPPQMEYFYALKLILHPEINTVKFENCFVPAPDNFTSTNHIA